MYVVLDLPQKVGALEGFVHISEVSWDKVDAITDLYSVGQVIEAVIVKFDIDGKRIHLSLKRLTKDPFEAIAEEFTADKRVSGTVVKVDDTGVTLTLTTKSGEAIEGFIRKEKIPPMTTYSSGQEASVIVSEVDKRRHRLVLVPALLEKPIGYR
jgi:ribosomal protein S1